MNPFSEVFEDTGFYEIREVIGKNKTRLLVIQGDGRGDQLKKPKPKLKLITSFS